VILLLNKNLFYMSEISVILKCFLSGAAVGCGAALCFSLWRNIYVVRRDDKLTSGDVLKWVLIGFLFGGSLWVALSIGM
jgi:hypothetical protein